MYVRNGKFNMQFSLFFLEFSYQVLELPVTWVVVDIEDLEEEDEDAGHQHQAQHPF